jgi:hypothetical protein
MDFYCINKSQCLCKYLQRLKGSNTQGSTASKRIMGFTGASNTCDPG